MNAEIQLIRTMGMDLRPTRIRANNYDINYVVAGDGPPLILLHGVNIGWGEWHLNIPELARHFRVYALDLPGAGNSTPIDFLTSDLERSFVETVEEFIRLLGLRDVVLIGHSSGGWTALRLALRGNVKISKLVVVNSLGFSDYLVWKQRLLAVRPIAKLLARRALPPTKSNMRKFLKSVFVDTGALSPEFMEYYSESVYGRMDAHPFMLIHRFLQPFRIRPEFVIADELHAITVPTLIVASDRDPLNSLPAMSRSFDRIAGAQVEIFRGTGHVPSMEQSGRFNKLIHVFLQ